MEYKKRVKQTLKNPSKVDNENKAKLKRGIFLKEGKLILLR